MAAATSACSPLCKTPTGVVGGVASAWGAWAAPVLVAHLVTLPQERLGPQFRCHAVQFLAYPWIWHPPRVVPQ